MRRAVRTVGECDFDNSLVGEYEHTVGFAADRLHLEPESPAVNAGRVSSVHRQCATGIDGQGRSDGMPDLGADELDP